MRRHLLGEDDDPRTTTATDASQPSIRPVFKDVTGRDTPGQRPAVKKLRPFSYNHDVGPYSVTINIGDDDVTLDDDDVTRLRALRPGAVLRVEDAVADVPWKFERTVDSVYVYTGAGREPVVWDTWDDFLERIGTPR